MCIYNIHIYEYAIVTPFFRARGGTLPGPSLPAQSGFLWSSYMVPCGGPPELQMEVQMELHFENSIPY